MFLDTYITNHELNILNATSAKKTLISELQKYERDTSHITTFSLVNSNIGHEGVLALVQVLNNNKFKNLTHLNLGFNNIGHEGALALVQALNNDKLKNLACLNLGFNNIGHEGALALVQALNNDKLKNLTHLNLSSNNIGHEGALALVQALNNDKLKNLTHLDLSFNNIGHEGALALVQALNNDKLKSLTHLDLRNSNIGHEGIKALNELKNSGRFPNLTIHFGGNTTNKEKPSIRLNNGDNSQSGENANHQPELEDIDINAGGADVINSANGKSEFHGESTQLESSDDNQNNDHLPKSDKLSSEDAERAVKDQSYVFYKCLQKFLDSHVSKSGLLEQSKKAMGIIDGYSKLIENPTDKLKKCVDEYHTWFILLADNIDIDSIANRTEAEKLKEFLQIIRRYDKSTSKFLPTNITALLKEVVQKGLGRIEESMQKLPIGTASNENDFKLEGSSGQKNKQQGSAFDTKDSSEPSTNIYFVGISATIGLFLGLSIAYLAGAATLTPVGAAVAVFLAAAAVGASVGYGVGKVSQKLLVEPINKHSKQESRV